MKKQHSLSLGAVILLLIAYFFLRPYLPVVCLEPMSFPMPAGFRARKAWESMPVSRLAASSFAKPRPAWWWTPSAGGGRWWRLPMPSVWRASAWICLPECAGGRAYWTFRIISSDVGPWLPGRFPPSGFRPVGRSLSAPGLCEGWPDRRLQASEPGPWR